MTALLCAVVMCVMTLQPIAFAYSSTVINAVMIPENESVVFYTDEGIEIRISDTDEYMGSNYDAVYREGKIYFSGVDDNDNPVSMSKKTFVFYAKTADYEIVSVGSGVTATVEGNDGNGSVEKDLAQWKVTIQMGRIAVNKEFKVSTTKAPTTVIFPNSNDYLVLAKIDGEYQQVTGTSAVDVEDDGSVLFKIVSHENADLSAQYRATTLTSGCTIDDTETAEDGIKVFKITNAQNNMRVNISPRKFTVTGPDPNNGFRYVPTSSSTNISYDGSFTFTVTPTGGYETPTVEIAGKDGAALDSATTCTETTNGNYVISNIRSDIVITVKAGTPNTYKVHLPNGTGYVAELVGAETEFEYGDTAKFTVKANLGYRVLSVKVNNRTVTAVDGAYMVSNITDDVEVDISVEKAPIDIVYDASSATENSYRLVNAASSALLDATYTFQVIPEAGYQAPAVSCKGRTIEPNGNQYSITIDATVLGDDGKIKITIGESQKTTYKVTLPSGTGYKVELTDGNTLKHGTNVTFTVAAVSGYQITAVKAGNQELTANADGIYTIANLTADVSVTVEVKLAPVTITYLGELDTDAYTITNGADTAEIGSTYTFQVVTKKGYNAPAVYVNNTQITPNGNMYSFTVTGKAEITVEDAGKISYSVSLPSGTGYKASFGDDGSALATIPYGETATFTITLDPAYDMTSVRITANGKVAELVATGDDGNKYTYSFKVEDNTDVSVVVTMKTYNVTFDETGNEAYALQYSSTTVSHGASYTFTVAAVEGYSAPVVTVKGEPINAVNGLYSVNNVGEDLKIKIVGGEILKFDVQLIENVGVEFTSADITVDYGTEYTIELKVNKYYDEANLKVYVNNIQINMVKGEDDVYTATISGIKDDKTVTVDIPKKTFTVTLTNSTEYTITAVSNTTVTAKDTFSFMVNVADAYASYTVKANGKTVEAVNGSYSITVTEDTTITVDDLVLKTFGVEFAATNVAVESSETVEYGKAFAFKLTPGEGYRVVSVMADNTVCEPIDDNGNYVIYNVTSDLHINVTTAKNSLTINYISEQENHKVKVSQDLFTYENVKDALSDSYRVDDCGIHEFAGWLYNGELVTEDILRAIVLAGDAEITLTAQFITDMLRIDSILTMVAGNRTYITNGENVTIPIRAIINVEDEYLNDPCLALKDVEITFGAMICNTEENPDTQTVRDAIRDGQTTVYNDNGGMVIVYTYDNTINMADAKQHNIYMNIKTNATVAAVIKNVANFVKYQVAGHTVVVIE